MKIILVQLPIPQLTFGIKTGNIPLGAACLKTSVANIPGIQVEVISESISSYLSDSALIHYILQKQPEIVGFTLYCWNIHRSFYLAQKLKEALPLKILGGGPEVVPDNPLIQSEHIDFFVFGEGEKVFRNLMLDPRLWAKRSFSENADDIFTAALSPYLFHLLEPGLEDIMLLETQRGCPYHCGYCNYNKAHKKVTVAHTENLLAAINWAHEKKISELCLLDPCLNTRPDLKDFLIWIVQMNKDKVLSINSEIRAEYVDEELADLFAAAGFSFFEIGLQSINPKALEIMGRPTDLTLFGHGVKRLKERGIRPRIDLILGLPGDNLADFKRSVDYLVTHELSEDIQIFPLSLLPGTDFRFRSKELGLIYKPDPPYTVLSTPSFSSEEMLMGIDYAQKAMDVSLYPFPPLDVSYLRSGEGIKDVERQIKGERYLWKLILFQPRQIKEIEDLAQRLCHPYQILVGPEFIDQDYLGKIVELLTALNPYTPLELVFFEPKSRPKTEVLLSKIKLARPSYLDIDLRYLYPKPGNRAVIFTLLSKKRTLFFQGEMHRQIFWWQKSELPERKELLYLMDFEGLLIDSPLPESALCEWQDTFSPMVNNIPWISFTDIDLQTRWSGLTLPEFLPLCF